MGKKDKDEFLDNLSPDLKKEILHTLVASLLDGLKEKEQKEILQSVLTSPPKSRELIDMVGH